MTTKQFIQLLQIAFTKFSTIWQNVRKSYEIVLMKNGLVDPNFIIPLLTTILAITVDVLALYSILDICIATMITGCTAIIWIIYFEIT